MRGSRWIKWNERICERIAYMLPREVVYWCIMRVFGEVSTGPYANKEAGAITAFDMAKGWDRRR